ncbi:MAG: FAD-dependent monooxygenase [Isosphaeraceae bacterium]|nr:FAD-dependent monooxygenase [Isosphaeraceae bacterium]
MNTVDGSVLIVGAGPVGLTMAANLERNGVGCRIVDKSPKPTETSKALVLWGRSLEMLDDLGIVGPFLAAGRFLGAATLNGQGRLLARIPLDVEGTEYPRPLMLAQSETERLLAEYLGRVGIAVERPVELTAFEDRGDHVAATLRHADGRVEEVRCDWLIGCDGAHSTVRHGLQMEFTGEAEPNDWILADCRVDGLSQDELSFYWHAAGALAFFPFAEGRCRIIADMGTAQHAGRPSDPSLAEVQAIVDQRGPSGVRLSEPRWLAGFRIHERKVSDYRRGRVFLAGDAAHIHSPAGGQGMNTGMQDAYNLAWKLGLVERGCGKASPLLDSYSQERGGVGELVLREAGRMTRAATVRNPFGQFLRNNAVWALGRLPAFRRNFVSYLSELTIHYPNSPLNAETEGAGWDPHSTRPGERVPDTRLRDPRTGDGQRLHSLLRGMTHDLLLLPSGDCHLRLAKIGQQAEAAFPGLVRSHLIVAGDGQPAGTEGTASVWLDPEGAVRRLIGAREEALALVRPDGYLGFRGQPASWDALKAYLDRTLIAGP